LSAALATGRTATGKFYECVDRVVDFGWFSPRVNGWLSCRANNNSTGVRLGPNSWERRENGTYEGTAMPDRFDVDIDFAVAIETIHCRLDPLDRDSLTLWGALGAYDHIVPAHL
jgi:hypothetical protein